MSELARQLGVNTGSMHPVLDVLVRDRYLVRDPQPEALPARPQPGRGRPGCPRPAAAIRRAREETTALAERFGLECLAAVVSGTDILIVGEAGRPERSTFGPGWPAPAAPAAPRGHPRRFMTEPERHAWLSADPQVTDAERDAYESSWPPLARGYEIGLETPTRQMIGLVLVELGDDPRSPELLDKLTDLVRRLVGEDHQLIDARPRPDLRRELHPGADLRRPPRPHRLPRPARLRPAPRRRTHHRVRPRPGRHHDRHHHRNRSAGSPSTSRPNAPAVFDSDISSALRRT